MGRSLDQYVCGMVIDPSRTRVVMVKKKRPSWQKGRYNFPGGRIKEGETVLAACIREVREETGMDIRSDLWTESVCLQGPDYIVHFCFAVSGEVNFAATPKITSADGNYDTRAALAEYTETVYLCDIATLHSLRVIDNIPMILAIGMDTSPALKPVVIYDKVTHSNDGIVPAEIVPVRMPVPEPAPVPEATPEPIDGNTPIPEVDHGPALALPAVPAECHF